MSQPGEARTIGERVLVVEDDPATRIGLTELVRTWGFQAESAVDGEDGLRKVTTFRPAIVITDLVMPRMSGLELLHELQEQGAAVSTVILTAQGTVETAVEAIKDGAYDYLTKPVDPQRLKILLDKVVERQETLREVKALRRQLREHGSFGRLSGTSPVMRKVYHIIEQAAPTSASVLIAGDSGTGKELVAQTIHQLSPRAAFPCVPINCAAIPDRCGSQGHAARGPLLPAQRVRDRSAAAARSQGGPPAAHPVVPQRVQREEQQVGGGGGRACDAHPRALLVAGQRPRAAQRHGARDDPRAGSIHRGAAPAARKERGSGIGLSMVYRIVQLHDGEVEVQSTPGSGTTFRLLLPRA